MNKYFSYFPGLVISLIIAFVANIIVNILSIHLISASVIALFIGMIINTMRIPNKVMAPGIKFTSKKILKFAIILLGASLNIKTIMHIGSMSLIVMVFTLLTCFGGGYFVGKALKLDWKLSNLISTGTGICGGSAIAAIAPVIGAEDRDIAYAMSVTFLFDMVMIILFPLMGQAMGLSDVAYGLWSGTAVNDTSSVVAAGYAFSEAAGDFAVMVKLTRTLAIIPTVLVFTFINIKLKKKAFSTTNEGNENITLNIKSIFPWFILGFLGTAVINSFGIIPLAASTAMKELSKFLMVTALAAIGLNTSFKDIEKSGFAPMIHGFIISVLVVIVAILAICFEEALGLI